MHLHYLTLKRHVEWISPRISHLECRGSFTQKKNEWVIELANGDEIQWWLMLSCDAQYPYMLLLPPGKRSPTSTDVLPEIIGEKIEKITIEPQDRIIHLFFTNSSKRLLFQFFTHHTNFLLLNADLKIINSFKKAKEMKGVIYQLPATQRKDLRTMNEADFIRDVQRSPQSSIARALRQFLFMNKTVITEICYRCNIPSDQVIQELTPAELQNCFQTARKFFDRCEVDNPIVYLEQEEPVLFALTPLISMQDTPYREFKDINEALRFFVFRVHRTRELIEKKKRFSAILEKRLHKIDKIIAHLSGIKPEEDKGAYYQKLGELLKSYGGQLRRGVTTVTVVDYFDERLPHITIKVDPEKSLIENAEIYFKKAKEVRESKEDVRKRIATLQRERTELLKLLEELKGETSFKKLRRIEQRLKEKHLLQAEVASREEFRVPFQRYRYKGYEIWVGKNARDNDEMTFKWAHKEDFWLHVQNYSGSHVIVRNPQKRDILPSEVQEYAARLAVSKSAGKHASYVPVMITKVKYVRKPRKSPPGLVSVQQSKTIYVDPLPVKE